MKAILMSIKPRHNKNICNHIKWWEIRKLFPLDYEGWVYIYNTKDTEYGYLTTAYVGNKLEFITSFTPHYKYYGKVIGRFWCDRVEEILFDLGDKEWFTDSCTEEKDLLKESCLQDYELEAYLEGKSGRAVHIQKLEIFDKPKEISEFSVMREYTNCGRCPLALDFGCSSNGWCGTIKPLTRAPQSWCYVEVQSMGFDFSKNSIKRNEQQIKLLLKGKWNDVDRLNYLLLGIAPYSRYARMGIKKALRHAIKLLKKEVQV